MLLVVSDRDGLAVADGAELPDGSTVAGGVDREPDPAAGPERMGEGEQVDANGHELVGGEVGGIVLGVRVHRVQLAAGGLVERPLAGAQPAALHVDLRAVATNLADRDLQVGVGRICLHPQVDRAGTGDDPVGEKRRGDEANAGEIGHRPPVVLHVGTPDAVAAALVGAVVERGGQRRRVGGVAGGVGVGGGTGLALRQQLPAAGEHPARCLCFGDRPGIELDDEVGLRGAGREGRVATLLEVHPHRWLGLERGQGVRVGHAREPALQGSERADAPERAAEGTGKRGAGGEIGDLLAHVQLQELHVAAGHGWAQRLGVQPVGERREHVRRGGERGQHVGEVAAGLLVLPGAGDEDGHLDPVDERDRRQRIAQGVGVVRVLVDLGDQVGVLQAQQLVVGAHLVAAVGANPRPLLTVGLAVVDSLLRPVDGEAGVEDAARVQRAAEAVVEHRERRDAVQARRLRGSDEQLADARVADAHHADLVVHHPRLGGDGFDDVVAVERLHGLEEPERAAAATGTAHVDAHVGEALGGVQRRQLCAVGVAGLVAAVLDDGGVGAGVSRAGQDDVGAQRGAVAHGDVPETACRQQRLVVVQRLRGHVGWVGHLERVGALSAALHHVLARSEVAEQQRPLRVDGARGDEVAGDGAHRQGRPGLGLQHGDLFGAGHQRERGRCQCRHGAVGCDGGVGGRGGGGLRGGVGPLVSVAAARDEQHDGGERGGGATRVHRRSIPCTRAAYPIRAARMRK